VLFRRHHKAIYNYLFRRTADWADAEDLMSATFLELWRRRNDLAPKGDSALPLLYGIAGNVLRNRRRSLRRRDRALTRLQVDANRAPNPEDNLDERVADVDLAQNVIAALDRLRPADREVIVLHVIEQLSYAEIAEALNIAEGTVASRLSRARKRLVDDPQLTADDPVGKIFDKFGKNESPIGHEPHNGGNNDVRDVATGTRRSYS